MTRAGYALIGVLLPGVLAGQAQELPAGTSRIHGRVVAGDSGGPLPGAQVSIAPLGAAPSAARRTTADANGGFEFNGIPAGRYGLSAGRAGYVTTQYREGPSAPPVAVEDRQSAGPLLLSLPPGAVISGRIIDAAGDPVAQAQVRAQRYRYGADGGRTLVDAGAGDLTDDLGQFRVHGLPAGDFIVVAGLRSALGTPAMGVQREGLPTYYPGTVNLAEAQTVSLSTGEEAAVQITAIEGRFSRLGGTVVRSDGLPPLGMRAWLRRAGVDAPSSESVGVLATGMFSLSNVPPGDYVIDVRGGRPDDPPEAASIQVTVAGEELVWTDVASVPGATIRGNATFDGSTPRPAAFRLRIVTASGPATAGLIRDAPEQGRLRPDGSFEMTGVIGRVVFQSADAGWIVKSVTVNGEELDRGGLDVTGRDIITGVQVTLSDRLTTLGGQVSDGRGRALADHLVVILQADAPAGSRPFVRAVRADANGRFELRGLPPGTYAAGAVDDLESGYHFSPEFQERLRTRGRGFTLNDGATVALELTPTSGLQ